MKKHFTANKYLPIALALAAFTAAGAAPAFADLVGFGRVYGTGNVMPSYYGPEAACMLGLPRTTRPPFVRAATTKSPVVRAALAPSP